MSIQVKVFDEKTSGSGVKEVSSKKGERPAGGGYSDYDKIWA